MPYQEINTIVKINPVPADNEPFRKPVKKILVNLNYDFLSDQIEFNNFKIDNKKASDKLLDIIEDFGDNSSNNWIKSKATLNTMFEAYEG